MLTAITRRISRSIINCELTHLERVPIDLQLARRQHRQDEDALRSFNIDITSLPEEPDMPDSVFVEDAAVVLDECAVLTRPGAPSRRPEIESIARLLSPFRVVHRVQAPGTLDGGDVLVVGKHLWVGLGSRTNQAAVDQLREFLHPLDYVVHTVHVTGCLHLKSAVTQAAPRTLLINPAWVDSGAFPGFSCIWIDPTEPHAGNILLVGSETIYQPAFPRTLARLKDAGIHPLLVDASELGKAEGALTCCSLVFQAHQPPE